VCLTESFLEYFDNSNFLTDFDCYISPAQKLSTRGRHSGGVVCFVRKCLSNVVRIVECSADNMLVFRISRYVFNLDRDILLFAVYVPPTGSPYYDGKDTNVGIELLEQCMLEMGEKYDCDFLLCGDFNSRTGKLNTCIDFDIYDMCSEPYDEMRVSQDATVNLYGKALLSLCLSFGLSILNGSVNSTSGAYTFVSGGGSSVIDYYIASQNMLTICKSLKIVPSVVSPHMCIELDLIGGNDSFDMAPNNVASVSKIVWNSSQEDVYITNLCNCLREVDFEFLLEESDDIDMLVQTFSLCLVQAADFLTKTFSRSHVQRSHKWFDRECVLNKRKIQTLLRKFQRTPSSCNRLEYIKGRNAYKELIRRKKKLYRQEVTNKLITSLKDCKSFWQQVKMMRSRRNVPCSISADMWVQHFMDVFASPSEPALPVYSSQQMYLRGATSVEPELLNSVITAEEVVEGMHHLKTGKAPGVDGVLSEMLKCSSSYIVQYLVKMFNTIWESGTFPRSWGKSIIVPLHKKGSYDDPNNYRGISLTSVFSKVFLHLVHRRLQRWVDYNDIIVQEQAGFRKGFSTIDNIFVIHGIIEKYLAKHKKVYMAFVDFRKAFDSVNRRALWAVLEKYGIVGKISNVLKSMYDSVVCSVRCENGVSEFFKCLNGVKQGCKCSPILFLIMVNSLALEIKDKGLHGVQLMPNTEEIVTLLFADDIVLISDTVVGLQNQLNNLETAADRLGLTVNSQKTKLMVFRKGGHIAVREKWSIANEPLEIVNNYKYLGNTFSTKLSSSATLDDLACKAKAAVAQICKSLKKLVYVRPDVFFKIFDTQVQPILLYGSEVWGSSDCNAIETVHLYAIKQFLNVSVKTPNVMAYGDTGRFPLSIGATMRVMKYWLKLLKMDEGRLPSQVYAMMLKNVARCTNWASRVKEILMNNNLEHYWLAQKVENENAFLCRIRESLIEQFREKWACELQRSERYSLYRSIKSSCDTEKYLHVIDKKIFRDVYIRFRFGMTAMYIHRHRFDAEKQLLCPLCKEEDEDEEHILVRCQALCDMRKKYLLHHIKPNDECVITQLFTSEETNTIRAVSTFLHLAMKRREECMELVDDIAVGADC